MIALLAAAALTATGTIAPPQQETAVLAACRAWMKPLDFNAEMTVTTVNGGICVNGLMDRGTEGPFLDALKRSDGKPVVIVVRSGGGAAEASLPMGQAVQAQTATVIADELCASSCADFILPAGKRRVVTQDTLLLYHGGVTLEALNIAAPQVEALAKKDPRVNFDHAMEQDRQQLNTEIALQEALLVREGISPSLFRWMDLINHMTPAEQTAHCPASSDIIAYPPEVLARFGLTFDSYGGPRSQAEVDAVVKKDGRHNTHICYWKDGLTP
jgi:hypothetical protein